MKTIDLFCASPASTAICSSMNQRAMVRHGSRPIDRHNNHNDISDHNRRRIRAPIPSSSTLVPIDPKSYNYQKISRKSEEMRRKSSADINDRENSSRYLLSDTPFIDFLSHSDHTSGLIQPVRPRRVTSSDSTLVKSSSTRTRTRHQVLLYPSHYSLKFEVLLFFSGV